ALQLLLGLTEGDHEQTGPHLVAVDLTHQAVSLVDGLRAGEGHPGEVQEVDLEAASDHPVRGHRGVDTARHQHQATPTHPRGQPALAGDALGEHERFVLVHLHVQDVVRALEVHPVAMGLDDLRAQVPGQFRGGHLEALVPAACPHGEGALAIGHGTHTDVGDGVEVLADAAHQVHPHNTHDVGHAVGDLGYLEIRGAGLADDDHTRAPL